MRKVFNYKLNRIINLKDNKFETEKILQKIIEKNLKKIFEDLEFVSSEFQLNRLRPDTVALDHKNMCFVIIEYKNKINSGITDQGTSYLDLLETHKGDFVLLYNEKKNKRMKTSDFDWKKSYVVLISPEFTKYQIINKSSNRYPDTQLWGVSHYNNGMIILDEIGKPIYEKPTKGKSVINRLKKNKDRQYSETKYINGNYSCPKPNEDIRDLYYEIKDKIVKTFDLDIIPQKAYVKFCIKNTNECVCTVEILKSSIKLCYNTKVIEKVITKSQFIINIKGKGKLGLGEYRSKINSMNDFTKALVPIKQVYKSKISNIR